MALDDLPRARGLVAVERRWMARTLLSSGAAFVVARVVQVIFASSQIASAPSCVASCTTCYIINVPLVMQHDSSYRDPR